MIQPTNISRLLIDIVSSDFICFTEVVQRELQATLKGQLVHQESTWHSWQVDQFFLLATSFFRQNSIIKFQDKRKVLHLYLDFVMFVLIILTFCLNKVLKMSLIPQCWYQSQFKHIIFPTIWKIGLHKQCAKKSPLQEFVIEHSMLFM